MEEPDWAKIFYPPIDYPGRLLLRGSQAEAEAESLDEVDPEILRTYEKLGIPLREQEMLAGAPMSRSTPFSTASRWRRPSRRSWRKAGSFSALSPRQCAKHPELVRKYLGSVVPYSDNYFATLNSAVFSDGSFVFVPKGVRCPMELSTYFRINAAQTGQFERTLIIAEEGTYVSYLEGCTAPMRDENQLHAAVVELVALDDAEIKYSTVQNWYPGDDEGRGGIYNFVTKRGACRGRNSKISWTQVETGSAITWKYPELHSPGRQFGRRILLHRHHQQPSAGRYRDQDDPHRQEHALDHHRQGHIRGHGQTTYRGLVKVLPKAESARNYTQCDRLLIGDKCGAHTVPYIESRNRRPAWNMKRPPPRSAKTNSSIASNAGSLRKKRCR